MLFPFGILYHGITHLRNLLYDKGVLKSSAFTIPTICVGNLRVGGTGKTPLVDYLIAQFLKEDLIVSVLSRGYGRRTKGFLKAGKDTTAEHIGDEPLQYFLNYNYNVNVYVDESRPHGIQEIVKDNPLTNLVFLDDAYQHRSLKASVNILVSDFNRPFYTDYLMPAGRLRESRKGAKRADMVIVTKCPDSLAETEMKRITSKIERYSKKGTPVYFTKILYSKPISLFNDLVDPSAMFVLVCGIENPEPFVSHCDKEYKIFEKFVFGDHHEFTKAEIASITQKNLPVLTTQKDATRLRQWKHVFQNQPVFYIPIEIKFMAGENEFLSELKKRVIFW